MSIIVDMLITLCRCAGAPNTSDGGLIPIIAGILLCLLILVLVLLIGTIIICC